MSNSDDNEYNLFTGERLRGQKLREARRKNKLVTSMTDRTTRRNKAKRRRVQEPQYEPYQVVARQMSGEAAIRGGTSRQRRVAKLRELAMPYGEDRG